MRAILEKERREEKRVKKLSERGSSGEEFRQGEGGMPTDARGRDRHTERRRMRKSYWTVHTVGLTYLHDSRLPPSLPQLLTELRRL